MWYKKVLGKLNILICLLLLPLLTSCGNKDVVSQAPTDVAYYLNRDETKIVPVSLEDTQYDLSGKDTKSAVEEAIAALSTDPGDRSLKHSLNSEVGLLDYSVKGGVLMLNFDGSYNSMSNTTEVLFRAAMVRTFDTIDGIESVRITVEGRDLTDSSGKPVGNMIADNFIDNIGDEINAYEQTTLTLYFASTDGTHLKKEVREVVYSSNISKEKLVVEQLIAGPKKEGLAMTIAPERKVNSVTTKDGVCYVNLSDLSIDTISLYGPIAEEVSVYSIVNSLCELPNVNKVQISLDGVTDRLYRENLPLDKTYERNLDLVEE